MNNPTVNCFHPDDLHALRLEIAARTMRGQDTADQVRAILSQIETWLRPAAEPASALAIVFGDACGRLHAVLRTDDDPPKPIDPPIQIPGPPPPVLYPVSPAVQARMHNYSATIADCHRLARVTGAPAHVITNGNLYWLAGEDDLPVYWRGLIGSGHARIVYTAWPRVAAFGDPPAEPDPRPGPGDPPIGWRVAA